MPVATSFAGARDAVVSAVDEKLAEEIRLSPLNGGNPDDSRPQHHIRALLRTGDEAAGPLDGVNGRGIRSRIAAGKAVLYIDRTRYPDIDLKKQDSVRAMDRPGKPAFEVSTIDDRHHARLIIGLNQK